MAAGPGRLLLARPFSTTDHLADWLRAAGQRLLSSGDELLLVTARAAGPCCDAELFGPVRLATHDGSSQGSEVAFLGAGRDPVGAVELLRRWHPRRIVVVHAGFGPPPVSPEGFTASAGVPLLQAATVAAVVAARCSSAMRAFSYDGDDGIAAALLADHAHGARHPVGSNEVHSRARDHGPHGSGPLGAREHSRRNGRLGVPRLVTAPH
ncbi:hypothetical protein [Streptomyces sp. NPDC058548]|uniref:hypothetical protein n=1 Tax=unclassified Streptomyces TaxID=2593676 RepID=UPI003667A695